MAFSSMDSAALAQQLAEVLAAAQRTGFARVVGLLTTDQVADLNDAAAAANLLLDGRTDEPAEVIEEFQPLTTAKPTSATWPSAAARRCLRRMGALVVLPTFRKTARRMEMETAGARPLCRWCRRRLRRLQRPTLRRRPLWLRRRSHHAQNLEPRRREGPGGLFHPGRDQGQSGVLDGGAREPVGGRGADFYAGLLEASLGLVIIYVV